MKEAAMRRSPKSPCHLWSSSVPRLPAHPASGMTTISTCLLMASSSAHHEGRGHRAAGQRGGVMSESLGLTSHKSSCNCTGCGLLRAGVCINCAEKIAALILESGPGELAAEPCSGACREAIELYFSTPPERWRAPRAL